MKNKLILLVTILIPILIGCSNSNTQVVRKPNVLIILTDDLGYGDISTYGNKVIHTPGIDKLAKQGVKCSDFYVPTPYCAPSRATLLTGRFPLRHKLTGNPTPDAEIDDIGIQDDEVTLAEILKDEGYSTKLVGKWHLGHKEEYYPENHGFDEYYGILYSNDMRPVQIVENSDVVEFPVDQSKLTKEYTAKAIEFINRNKNNPFFLHLCHAMPHKPLAASKQFYTPQTKDDLYHDVIRELDWSVTEIVNTLDKLDILDNTIIVFMSDNGPWYGGNTGGLKGMKATTWEGGIRVPFIIRFPKVFTSNKTIDIPCWSPDVFPTILSLVGIKTKLKNAIDGENIVEILNGNNEDHSPIFSMLGNKILSVRKGDYKLFVEIPKSSRLPSNWVDPRGPDGKTILAPYEQATPDQYPGVLPQKVNDKYQLFNLKVDRAEENDISEANPEIVQKLLNDYEVFLNSTLGE